MTRRELLVGMAAARFAAFISGRGDAMHGTGNIKILFIAGFGPIVREEVESRKLYREALGIPFKEETDGYLHTGALRGAKSFALWPLSQAAQSCFGKDSWPDDIPAPQAWLEFDVDSVDKATAELESRGHRMLVKNKKEPMGANRQSLHLTGRITGGHYFYSLDARTEIVHTANIKLQDEGKGRVFELSANKKLRI